MLIFKLPWILTNNFQSLRDKEEELMDELFRRETSGERFGRFDDGNEKEDGERVYLRWNGESWGTVRMRRKIVEIGISSTLRQLCSLRRGLWIPNWETFLGRKRWQHALFLLFFFWCLYNTERKFKEVKKRKWRIAERNSIDNSHWTVDLCTLR